MKPTSAWLAKRYLPSLTGIGLLTLMLGYLQTLTGVTAPIAVFLTVIAYAASQRGFISGFLMTLFSTVCSAWLLFKSGSPVAANVVNNLVQIGALNAAGLFCTVIIADLFKREKNANYAVGVRENQLKQIINGRNRTQSDLNLYITLAKSSNEYIGMYNLRGEPYFINEAGLRMIGQDSLLQAVNYTIRDLFFPEDQAIIMDDFLPKVMQEEQASIEIRFRHFKTGAAIWMRFHVFLLKDAGNQITGLGTVSTNITDRKIAEACEQQPNLYDEVFLAALADRLRTPLAPVLNAVQYLKAEENPDSKRYWTYHLIDKQLSDMTAVLEDVLDFSRLLSGEINLSLRSLRLNDLIRDCLTEQQPVAEARQIRLKPDLSDSSLWINADAVRLTQVIRHVLDNAIRFSRDGGQIQILMYQEHNQAVLEVKDAGIGIANEVLPYLFQPFGLHNPALPVTSNCMGLGLPLAHHLISRHQGSLTARSPGLGQGSIFSIRLPLVNLPVQQIARPNPNHIQHNARILLIDNRIESTLSLKILLQLQGYHVENSYQGLKALEKAKAFRPHIILIDLGLPDMAANELAAKFRSLRLPETSAIFALSDYAQRRHGNPAQANQFNYVFLRPLNIKEFNSVMNNIALQTAPTPTAEQPEICH